MLRSMDLLAQIDREKIRATLRHGEQIGFPKVSSGKRFHLLRPRHDLKKMASKSQVMLALCHIDLTGGEL